jgi:CRISPR/Cas system CSM-associated protein Csm3 (group 7 of RAMP superfamily)
MVMNAHYQRIKIRGIITTQSEMTVASGHLAQIDSSKRKKNQSINDKAQQYTEICLDCNNNPYIPASSLRGLLANLCPDSDSVIKKALFGDAENKTEGKVRIYDASWQAEDQNYQKSDKLRSRNRINSIIGTAKDHHLFNEAYIPALSRFDWEIEADLISAEETQYLFGLLCCLSNNPKVQLGKGQSRQRGLFNWQLDNNENHIEVLTQDNLIKWLLQPETSKLNYSKQAIVPAAINLSNQISAYTLKFKALSPLLINDPDLVTGNKKDPQLEYYRNGSDELIIPASSIKGVLRSHCRKILLTLIMANSGKQVQDDHQQENQQADNLLATLFGNTGLQSRIWTSDVTATSSKEHTQTFNAVDRFTGGVADTKLYKAHAASAETLTTMLYIDHNPHRYEPLLDWQKGLLILLIRDALEGDLTVGWGKAKGYGSIRLTEITLSAPKSDWAEVIAYFGKESAQNWVAELNAECGKKTKNELETA